jgi:catechol 2,3-dioxygenase-like lactoylglutathione lyase family enzyme
MSMSDGKTIPNDIVMLQDFHHICLLVRDVEKAAQNFAKAFGVGPFAVTHYETPTSKGTVHGKPQGYKLKFANAKVGPITLELVEPVEGNSALTEFLKERGEGLHHLAYRCPPPIDEELAKWKKLGIDALQVDKNISDDPRYGWAYMDTEKLVGCVLEILCLPP